MEGQFEENFLWMKKKMLEFRCGSNCVLKSIA